MKSDVKIKRALIDTPGIKTYKGTPVRYTPEFLEKLSTKLRKQIVELDFHNSGKYGEFVKMGFCPTHGLWADLAVPADAPEDDIKFSTHLDQVVYEDGEDGIREIADAELLKVVWSTPNGPNVRNPNTQLCNTEDDTIEGESNTNVNALNVRIGELQNQLTAEQNKTQTLEQKVSDLEQKLQDTKTAKDTVESELQVYKNNEEQSKESLLEEVAGDNELLKKAYSNLSIAELEELKNNKQPQDTQPKGAKAKAVPKGEDKKKEDEGDEKPSYADLQKARKEGRI